MPVNSKKENGFAYEYLVCCANFAAYTPAVLMQQHEGGLNPDSYSQPVGLTCVFGYFAEGAY